MTKTDVRCADREPLQCGEYIEVFESTPFAPCGLYRVEGENGRFAALSFPKGLIVLPLKELLQMPIRRFRKLEA